MRNEIRSATLSDADQIGALLDELGYKTTNETLQSQMPTYLQDPKSAIFVAEMSSQQLTGLISGHLLPLLHQPGNLGRITAMVVSENSRGAGVGRKLVEKLESWFRKNNCSRFEVTSGDHRIGAHRFYEGFGYQLDERRFLKLPTD